MNSTISGRFTPPTTFSSESERARLSVTYVWVTAGFLARLVSREAHSAQAADIGLAAVRPFHVKQPRIAMNAWDNSLIAPIKGPWDTSP